MGATSPCSLLHKSERKDDLHQCQWVHKRLICHVHITENRSELKWSNISGVATSLRLKTTATLSRCTVSWTPVAWTRCPSSATRLPACLRSASKILIYSPIDSSKCSQRIHRKEETIFQRGRFMETRLSWALSYRYREGDMWSQMCSRVLMNLFRQGMILLLNRAWVQEIVCQICQSKNITIRGITNFIIWEALLFFKIQKSGAYLWGHRLHPGLLPKAKAWKIFIYQIERFLPPNHSTDSTLLAPRRFSTHISVLQSLHSSLLMATNRWDRACSIRIRSRLSAGLLGTTRAAWLRGTF